MFCALLVHVAAASLGAAASSAVASPLLPAQGGGWATVPSPTCDDGAPYRQPFYWGMFDDPPPNTSRPSIDLGADISKVQGLMPTRHLCIYPTYWSGIGNRSWPSSPSAIWPVLTGPYCDKKADPNCTPEYIRTNGGCPQNISLVDHAAAVAEGVKVQVPEGFDG